MARILIAVLLLTSANAFAASGCGITFSLPKGWTVQVTRPGDSVCAIDVSPPNWREILRKARWPDDDRAIRLEVITGTLDDAARAAGFRREDDGKLWTMDRGGRFRPDRVTYGGMRGYEACGWYRGFAKDGVELGDQSRIYSGEDCIFLLQHKRRSFIVLKYHAGNPDIDVDRPGVARRILATIGGR